MKNKKGFTLSEVLVIIALISVIMLIAVPSVITIKKKINKRLFESKKELILIAAEQYGSDNDGLFDLSPNSEITIFVNDLIKFGYIEKEENAKSCDIVKYAYGCVTNPENDSVLNDTPILIVRKKSKYMAHWDEDINGNIAQDMLNTVCQKLGKDGGITSNGENCTCEVTESTITLSTGTNCYFNQEDPSNWLYYSEEYFRIMGIEYLEEKSGFYVKMITQNAIE